MSFSRAFQVIGRARTSLYKEGGYLLLGHSSITTPQMNTTARMQQLGNTAGALCWKGQTEGIVLKQATAAELAEAVAALPNAKQDPETGHVWASWNNPTTETEKKLFDLTQKCLAKRREELLRALVLEALALCSADFNAETFSYEINTTAYVTEFGAEPTEEEIRAVLNKTTYKTVVLNGKHVTEHIDRSTCCIL